MFIPNIKHTARFEWSASHLGQDSIIITAEDPSNCLHQPSSSGKGHGNDCTYRIAVFGYQPSHFTLVARFNSSDPLPLTLGQPQGDRVMAGTFRQYALDITPEMMRMPDGAPSDLQVDTVTWCNSGVPFPQVRRAGRSTHRIVSSTGPPIPNLQPPT